MIKIAETTKGFRITATTRRDQEVLSRVFQSIPSDATFSRGQTLGDMAHYEWFEFDYRYKPPVREMGPYEEQD